MYIKVVLTVIAACLLALTLEHLESTLHAGMAMHCKGTAIVNVWGVAEPIIGGYDIDVRCD